MHPAPPRLADPAPVLADLKALAAFGAEGRGVSRPSYSAPDMAARRWLVERMAAAGLDAAIDGVGNVLGTDPRARHTVLAGSHSDSVPRGGWLDGALGVVFALGAARAWRRANPSAPVGVDVVAFADEEGTYDSCVGSRALCGTWTAPADGASPLRAALAAANLSGVPGHRLDPLRQRAYLEAHIEQGPRLEQEGGEVGVVLGIVGVRRKRVRFTGRADHAGTTPMAVRRDAGRAMIAFCAAVEDAFRRSAPAGAVWNMGVLSVSPGAANVVPRSAEVVVEYRHLDGAALAAMTAMVQDAADRSDLPVSLEEVGALEPAAMEAGLVADLRAAAAACGARSLDLPSGAGHDAMILAGRVPAAMMFVPSIGGRSHDPAEDTAPADLERGYRVYEAWVFRVLERLASILADGDR